MLKLQSRPFQIAVLLVFLGLSVANSSAASRTCAERGVLNSRVDDLYSKSLRQNGLAESHKIPRINYDEQVSVFRTGVAALEQRHYPAARDAFAQSVQIQPTYAALFNLALTEQLLGNFAQSKARYREAESFHPNDPELATNLGIVLGRLAETDQALELFNKALRLIGNSHSGRNERGRILLHLGILNYGRGDLNKSLEVLADAESAFEQAGCLVGRAIAASTRANVFFDLQQPNQGEELFRWAIQKLERLQATGAEAKARTDLGLHYLTIGRSDEAFAEFTRSIELARTGNHILELARALNGAGVYYLKKKDFNTALPLLQEALHHFQVVGDPSGEAQGNNNLTILHQQQGHNREALAYSLSASSLYVKVGSYDAALIQLLAAAQISRLLGDSDAADPIFEKALALSRQVPDQALRGRVFLAAAEFHLDRNVERATKEAAEAKTYLDAAQRVDESAEAARLLQLIQGRKMWKIIRIALWAAILVFLLFSGLTAAIRRLVATNIQLIWGRYKKWEHRWAGLDRQHHSGSRELLKKQQTYWKRAFLLFLFAACAIALCTDFFAITYPDIRAISRVNAMLERWPIRPDVKLDIQQKVWALKVCVVTHFVAQALLFCAWLVLLLISVRFVHVLFYGLSARFGKQEKPPKSEVMFKLATSNFKNKRTAAKFAVGASLLLFMLLILYPQPELALKVTGLTVVSLTALEEAWLFWKTRRVIPTLGVARPEEVYGWLQRTGRDDWISTGAHYVAALWLYLPALYIATRWIQRALTYDWLSRISSEFVGIIYSAVKQYHNLLLPGDIALLPFRLQEAYKPTSGTGELWRKVVLPFLPYALFAWFIVGLFRVVIPWAHSLGSRQTGLKRLKGPVVVILITLSFDKSIKFFFHFEPQAGLLLWLVTAASYLFHVYVHDRVKVEMGPLLVASSQRRVYHKRDCNWGVMIPSAKRVSFQSDAQAAAAGYRPCKVCHP